MINISLGGEDPSNEMRNAIAYAVQQGAFVAMAMGNDYEDGNPIEYPAFYAASIDGAMSVAAVTQVLEPRAPTRRVARTARSPRPAAM